MLEEIDTLWRTAPLRPEKPSPTDEVRAVMAVFDETLYTAIPHVYRRVDDALQGPAAGGRAPVVRPFVRVGSWVGGDRDGNPFVTASVTRKAAAIASEHVLLGLERTANRIGRGLTLDASTTPPSEALLSLWQRLKAADEEAADEVAKRSPNEPHRRILLLIARRIAATRARNADLAYRDPEQLLADLRIVQDSLVEAGAPRQAYGHLQQLLWQVETFGFHLTELEVRQHSAVHAKVLAELDSGAPRTELTEEVLDVFRAIAFLQERYGPRAAGRYIVSFTQSAEDLANVRRLARYAAGPGRRRAGARCHPAVRDVRRPAGGTPDPRGDRRGSRVRGATRRDRAAPGGDARLLGLVEGRRTGRREPRAVRGAGGDRRVGSAERHRADALPRSRRRARPRWRARQLRDPRPAAALGRRALQAHRAGRGDLRPLRRSGDRDAAHRPGRRRRPDGLGAVHRRRATATRQSATPPSPSTMDAASRERFFELVKAPGFAPWFAQVTPMEEVGLLALGSRPARRGLSVESLEDLRAIPWVFAWTQARINLAGWFGLGTALDAVGDEDLLRRAYQDWPLFHTMVDNVAMSLAKADPRIARRYLDLGDREDLAELVMDEMELTRLWVCGSPPARTCSSNKPVLQRAVKMRSPYVDALSLLQLRALRALRDDAAAGAPTDPEQQRLLLLSVSGVAAGLQNTG